MNSSELILVTGVTGYIGGRLVPHLLEAGYRLRCMVRDAKRLQGRPWLDQVEVVEGDPFYPETLPDAMDGVSVAYYFIHSLVDTPEYHERDLALARNFAQAAKAAGVKRIIYLGGLGDPETRLSVHLRSRQLTGQALSEAGVPVTEFRAAIIVGSGSLSFEMIRYLTERLPLMICPRWVYTSIQPIAIQDVLSYLVAALEVPESTGRVVEIGGADVRTYADMMFDYARVRGLRRLMIRVPVLTPYLSAHWVNWITPAPAGIVYPLIEGLRNEVVVRDNSARTLFPAIEPIDHEAAVRQALADLDAGSIETTWTDALSSTQGHVRPVKLRSHTGMNVERRQQRVNAPPEAVYATFAGLGGQRGWLYADWLWRLRGLADYLLGGSGFHRKRRDPDHLRVGDTVDFWRVEAVKPGQLLRLRAEMKLPGRAWLQLRADPHPQGGTVLSQTAFFAPKGLLGFLYWYGLYPIHTVMFRGLIRAVAQRAEALAAERPAAALAASVLEPDGR